MSASPAPSNATTLAAGDGELPAHVAIIMDGNGRWARTRGLPRSAGHERGVEALRRTVSAAGELGIRHLTVFSFSTENWHRPASEVSALFGLLRTYVKRDLNRLKAEGVRVRVIGARDHVPSDILDLIDRAERETASNDAFNLTIAFNYGGREEILRAARTACAAAVAGELDPASLTGDQFSGLLDTHMLPDPDLLIRTSGEFRISNFLLWQMAYTELVFLDVLWPDFGRAELEAAIRSYIARERRFGGIGAGGR